MTDGSVSGCHSTGEGLACGACGNDFGPRRYYLRSLRMDAFGGFRDREEGPFTPGLNVVWGANESGKTSMAKFIGGVLFGWDDARGSKNAYRPKGASQSGSLVFANLDDPRRTLSCFRARNADGLVQSEAVEIIGDMDKEAYSTVFSLNSDELRGLGDAEAVIDKLLTAGSGTDASPAQALARVDAQMKACFSKAASKPQSIPNLKNEISQVKSRIAAAEAESDRLAAYDAEARELKSAIPVLQRDIACANERMEALASARDALARLDDQERQVRSQDAAGDADGHKDAASRSDARATGPAICHEGSAGGRAASSQDSKGLGADSQWCGMASNGNSLWSDVASNGNSQSSGRVIGDVSRLPKAALGVFVALCLVGVALLVLACLRSQLVFAVGAATVFLAAACSVLVAILLFRNGASDCQEVGYPLGGHAAQRSATGQGEVSAEGAVRSRQAAGHGTADWGASSQEATFQEASSQEAASGQATAQQAAAQQAAVRAQLQRIACERAAICSEWGVDAHDAARQQSLLMQRESQLRESLQQQLTAANRRSGELCQILASARGANDLETLRTQEQMLQARLRESCRTYAKLVLARSALVSALEAWECSSQPRVFDQAGRLLSIMTNGAWCGVRPVATGMEVVDYAGIPRSARELSLGTCQQLYLALRVALLMVAGSAGANLPVIADDILVHFDDERREAAVLALLELARHRQVILLTCHSSVVELVRNASADANVLRL